MNTIRETIPELAGCMAHGDSYQSALVYLMAAVWRWSRRKGCGWPIRDWSLLGAVIREKLDGVLVDG
ncbi:MAG: hypothetical protein C1943_06710 [Halochromatium sp.]|nr:hypothetical protein [Halochromatium sp.]